MASAQVTAVVGLRNAGHSDAHISELFGISRNAVSQTIRRARVAGVLAPVRRGPQGMNRRMAEGKLHHGWTVARRPGSPRAWLVAKSCTDCLRLVTPSQMDASFLRCRSCHREYVNGLWSEAVRNRQADYVRRHPEVARVFIRTVQGKTRDAPRFGAQWTGPEMELAARTDLSVLEIAEITGRTYKAVISVRYRMKEPKWVAAAGIPRSHG